MLSSILLVLVIFLELLGSTQAQQKLENFGDKILGLSTPFGINLQNPKIKGESTESSVSILDIQNLAPLPFGQPNSEPVLSAGEAILVDLATNRVLYKKLDNTRRPIASVTKLMTALVVLEDLNPDEVVTVTEHAAFQPESRMNLRPGEKISARELVKGALIASANDAACALEDHYGKEKIVDLMNKKAAFLGMVNTHFVETTGLDEGNQSTVADLAILANYALKNKEVAYAVGTIQYTVTSVDGSAQYQITTSNRLLKNFSDVVGVKTGYTQEAGNCLVAAAEREGHRLVAIVLNVPNNDVRFSEARELLDWGFDNFKW